MIDGVVYVLVVATYVAFAGLFLLLCIRTRSKGMMVILIAYIGFAVVDAITKPIFDQYVGPWTAGEISNWLTESMSIGEFVMRSDLVKRFLYYGMNLIGVFLIYKEWKLGKFNYPQSETVEDPNANKILAANSDNFLDTT